jgi:hypothetical protein
VHKAGLPQAQPVKHEKVYAAWRGRFLAQDFIITEGISSAEGRMPPMPLLCFLLINRMIRCKIALKSNTGKDRNTTRLVVRVQIHLPVTVPPWLSVLCFENQGGFIMQKTASTLTVLFDDPFWVGVYERVTDGKLEVCKITFGAEPKDYEVYAFLLQNWHKLQFSPPVKIERRQEMKMNPKRVQRAISKQLATPGIGTKAQQALKLQQEKNKVSRKQKSRQQKEEEKRRQFELRQQKKKKKHKGR